MTTVAEPAVSTTFGEFDPRTAIKRHHHITLCVGVAQEDYDFHTQILGLKSVKKTALYDGGVPIYHLYYGNDVGSESQLITTFPMRQSGRVGKRGSNQTRTLMLSIPEASLPYWYDRLTAYGLDVANTEVLGEQRLSFAHPCGIPYELVGTVDDPRTPHTGGPVPVEHGIRGTHGITVSVTDLDLSHDFATQGWSGRLTREDAGQIRFEVGAGGPGAIYDFIAEPNLPQAGWTYGEGIVHHTAFQVDGFESQAGVKFHLEGLGFTDVSERKDRGYFLSVFAYLEPLNY
jgi:glyoxalase family protein